MPARRGPQRRSKLAWNHQPDPHRHMNQCQASTRSATGGKCFAPAGSAIHADDAPGRPARSGVGPPNRMPTKKAAPVRMMMNGRE